MQAPLFIVWRESIEALLVIGILYAWLKRENLAFRVNRLWIGTALGLLLSGLLAVLFWMAGNWFSGTAGEWFFAAMTSCAGLLILHMVVWMHSHGKNMKKQLEADMSQQISRWGGMGITVLAMLAVAREGSETVIFLAGVGVEQQGTSLGLFVFGGFLGFVLAVFSFILLQKFSNAVSWRWFFRLSAFMLLLIGGAMMITAADKAAAQLSVYDLPEWAYSFMDTPLWNTQGLLADSSTLTSLTGYHATPSLMQVSVLALYWAVAIFFCSGLLQKSSRQRALQTG